MLLSINSSTNVPIVVSLVFQNSNVLPSEVAAGMKHHMIVILVFHSVTKRFRSFQNPFSRSSMLQKISAQHQEIVIPTFSKSHNCISKEKHVIMVLRCCWEDDLEVMQKYPWLPRCYKRQRDSQGIEETDPIQIDLNELVARSADFGGN